MNIELDSINLIFASGTVPPRFNNEFHLNLIVCGLPELSAEQYLVCESSNYINSVQEPVNHNNELSCACMFILMCACARSLATKLELFVSATKFKLFAT